MVPRIGRRSILDSRWAATALCLVAVLALASVSSADAFLDKANAASAATSGTKPAQDVLFPALAAMTEPPVPTGWARSDLLELLLAAPGEANWKSLEAWAAAEPQQNALKALDTIAGDTKDRYIIGIAYGRDAVSADWAEAGLCVDLNAEGLLYSAQFSYLKRIGWLVGLATFESARAASAGDGTRSLELCVETVKLGRMLVERAYLRETLAGSSIILVGLERLRDVLYQFPSAFNPKKIKEAAETLDGLRIREVQLAIANKLAVDQIIARTYTERGKVDGAKLAAVMSGARTASRPLLRLSEAAFWSDRAGDQADWFDVTDKIKGVWADWEQRWKLADLYDPLFEVPTDFRKMDANAFLVVYYPLNGMDELFNVRKSLLVEIGGTIDAMGCAGFRITQKTLPPLLVSVEPNYIAKVIDDLYAVDLGRFPRTFKSLRYWVPIRDQTFDRREDPHPYDITVAMISGAGLFVGGGQDAVDRSVLAQIAPNFSLPPGIGFSSGPDDADMQIDAAKLKGLLLASASSNTWSPKMLRDLTATLKKIADSGVTNENFDTKFEQAFAAFSGDVMARLVAMGVDIQEVNAIAKDASKVLLALSSVQNGIEAVKRDESINADDAKKMMSDAIEAVVQPTFTDRVTKVLRDMRDKARASIEAAGGEGKPTTVFQAKVDDSQFLLYSVGPDGVDGRARLVGPAGSDILFWPPILSLQRNASHGAK